MSSGTPSQSKRKGKESDYSSSKPLQQPEVRGRHQSSGELTAQNLSNVTKPKQIDVSSRKSAPGEPFSVMRKALKTSQDALSGTQRETAQRINTT